MTVAKSPGPWSQNPRTLLIVAAAAFALLGLVALASAIDLPTRETATDAPPQRLDEQTADQRAGSGFDSEGRVEVGENGAIDIRPIPGCPDGFSIGDDIYVVPDPEACGFRPVDPGERGFEPNGKILLVPDVNGDVGGIRIGPDGEVQLLPPGVLGPNDFAIGQLPDGSFGLVRPDGSRVEIAPGDDGLSLRDPERGGSEFFSADDQLAESDPFGSAPPPVAQEPPAAAQPDSSDTDSSDTDSSDTDSSDTDSSDTDSSDTDSSNTDWSFLWPALIVLLAAVVLGSLIMALRNTDWRKNDELDSGDEGAVQDTLVDYSTELNALDRLLWEIDQEPDPRTAIRRVYAALETGLDNPDMARKRSETPGLYLRRVLGRFTELDAPLHELTDLFEQARFSEHEITPQMRDRAVTSLVAVRGHYASAMAQPEPGSDMNLALI